MLEREIVLWGPVAAGKTMYVAQLALGSPYIAPGGETLEIFPDSPTTDRFVRYVTETIIEQNRFPAATDSNNSHELSFRVNHSRLGSGRIRIDDIPGGTFREMEAPISDKMASADGLLMLYNTADHMEQSLGTLPLIATINTLAQRGRDGDTTVSMCVSKIDKRASTWDQVHEMETDPDGFVTRNALELGMSDVIKRFSTWRNVRYFPVSSIGVAGDPAISGATASAAFLDERLEPRVNSAKSHKINLAAPLFALLEATGS